MAARTRIGAVSYLNTRPLVFGLEQGLAEDKVELSYDVPAKLADRMLADELEIALMPVIELAKMPQLEIVPGLAIGTNGPSRSVLLIAKKSIDDVRTIALDRESRTSNALVQVLCHRVWKIQPEFDAAGDLESCDAVVSIGDKALFPDPPDGCFVYDLGGVWTAATGKPFVFATWFVRPGALDRDVYEALHESRRRGTEAIPLIAADYSWGDYHNPRLAQTYLQKNIRHRLGSVEIDAMRDFYRSAAEIGIIDAAPEPKLALTRWTSCHEAAQAAQEAPHAES